MYIWYRDIKREVDFSNYATKTDVKNVTDVDASGFALKKSWLV